MDRCKKCNSCFFKAERNGGYVMFDYCKYEYHNTFDLKKSDLVKSDKEDCENYISYDEVFQKCLRKVKRNKRDKKQIVSF